MWRALWHEGGVAEYAKSFAVGQAPAPELLPEFTPTRDPESVGAEGFRNRTGLELIESLTRVSADLAGRCAGRNHEEAQSIATSLAGGGSHRCTLLTVSRFT